MIRQAEHTIKPAPPPQHVHVNDHLQGSTPELAQHRDVKVLANTRAAAASAAPVAHEVPTVLGRAR